MIRCELKWGTRIVIVSHNTSGWSDWLKWFHTEPGWSFCVPTPVDRPTQLICISDTYLYLFVFLCKQTNTKDIAGQSATPTQKFLNEVQENRMILDNDKVWNQMRNFGAQTRIVRRANDDLCINILISKMVIFSPRYLAGGLLHPDILLVVSWGVSPHPDNRESNGEIKLLWQKWLHGVRSTLLLLYFFDGEI